MQLNSYEECDSTFQSKLGMNLNTRTKLEGVKYSCDQCKYQASWPGHKESQRIKHEGGIHSCNQCEYQLTWKDKLKRHKESGNQCDYQVTTQQGHIKQHKQT